MHEVKSSDLTLACVRCDKPIRPMYEECRLPERGAYHDAGVHEFVVGYGSAQYDTSTFIIGICDECLVKLHKAGTIYEKSNCFEAVTTNPRVKP